MATILEFRPALRPSMSVCRARAADIVLFPGVRYERWAEAPPADKKPAKKTKKRTRDVLEPGE
ncbi:MAG: hypothetical protein ACT4OU_06305 [Hyphomicrobium sp.]